MRFMWHHWANLEEDGFRSLQVLQYINMTDWNLHAKAILKAELALKGIGYKRLSQLLEDIGVDESPSAITNKMSRGAFSFAFFLQCMKAIGRVHVQIDLKDI